MQCTLQWSLADGIFSFKAEIRLYALLKVTQKAGEPSKIVMRPIYHPSTGTRNLVFLNVWSQASSIPTWELTGNASLWGPTLDLLSENQGLVFPVSVLTSHLGDSNTQWCLGNTATPVMLIDG